MKKTDRHTFIYIGNIRHSHGEKADNTMTLLEITQALICEHESDMSPIRGFFGFRHGQQIIVNAPATQKLFSSLFQRACELLGEPLWVHSYYGYLWEKNGAFLACNVIDEYNRGDTIRFFLLNRLSCGKKLHYRDYAQTVDVIRHVFADHHLACGDGICYHDKTFVFLADNNEIECLLLIKSHSLFFSYSQKEQIDERTTRIMPCYTRRKKIPAGDADTIKRAVENCFAAE